MSYSSLLSTFLGSGLLASRPVAATIAATVPPGWVALWYATDTGVLYSIVNGASAWAAVGGGAASGPAGPMGFGMDGADGEDGMSIPGAPGPAGASGVGTNPSVVQMKSAVGNSGSVTFDSALTLGNLLVVVGTHWASAVAVGSGWNTILNVAGGTDGTIILTKIVSADETGSTTINPYGAVSGACLTAFEITGSSGSLNYSYNYKQETAGTAVAVNFGLPKNGTLLVGHAATLSANTAPTSITNAGTVGTTVQGTASNASPRQATPWYVAGAAKGGVTITGNYAVSASQYIAGVTVTN